MRYLGCSKQSGSCDRCGAAQEFLHSMGGGAHLCLACAEKTIAPRKDRGMPAIAESWSKTDGGKWVSRWHIEEAYQ